jgi:hypothetical protein
MCVILSCICDIDDIGRRGDGLYMCFRWIVAHDTSSLKYRDEILVICCGKRLKCALPIIGDCPICAFRRLDIGNLLETLQGLRMHC